MITRIADYAIAWFHCIIDAITRQIFRCHCCITIAILLMPFTRHYAITPLRAIIDWLFHIIHYWFSLITIISLLPIDIIITLRHWCHYYCRHWLDLLLMTLAIIDYWLLLRHYYWWLLILIYADYWYYYWCYYWHYAIIDIIIYIIIDIDTHYYWWHYWYYYWLLFIDDYYADIIDYYWCHWCHYWLTLLLPLYWLLIIIDITIIIIDIAITIIDIDIIDIIDYYAIITTPHYCILNYTHYSHYYYWYIDSATLFAIHWCARTLITH
jgi:hypothetical protein